MRPLSTGSWPEICPISVVLPAPFGPISACTSPRSISRVTSSVAATPPKCFDTLRSSSTALRREQARQPLRRGEHDGEEHHADGEAGVVLVARREALEPAEPVVGDQVLEAEQH